MIENPPKDTGRVFLRENHVAAYDVFHSDISPLASAFLSFQHLRKVYYHHNFMIFIQAIPA